MSTNATVSKPIKSSNGKETTEDDEIAILLDSIPELDSRFSVIKKIGQGTFSSVYLGQPKVSSSFKEKRYYAIKQIIPTSHPSRIYMELKCLKLMGGKDNIIGACLYLRNLNHIILVMPYFHHDIFMDYVGSLTTEEICDYLLNIFIALKKVHELNIIHRDIKPANFLYSRKHRRYALIDFGLAQDVTSGLLNQPQMSCPPNPRKQDFLHVLPETPHLSSNGPVKRKLTIANIASPDLLNSSLQTSKKSRLTSFVINHGSSQLSSSSDLSFIRRSPRKLCALVKNTHKENLPLISSGADSKAENPQNDSPSKHTRLAESFRTMKNSLKSVELIKGGYKTPEAFSNSCSTPLQESTRMSLNSLRWDSVSKSSCIKESLGSSCNHTNPIDSSGKSFRESPFQPASVSGFSRSGALRSESLNAIHRSSAHKTSSGPTRSVPHSSCNCYGSNRVCPVCLGRKNERAPRAGTPGFRAPEVLLRHPQQTTAVDMWSVGVILFSFLSGRYPFFRAVDDLSSLAEITTILGTKAIKRASANLGKLFTTNQNLPPLDLKKICEKLKKQDFIARNETMTLNNTEEKKHCDGCKQYALDCVCLVPQQISAYFFKNIDTPRTYPDDSNLTHPQNQCSLVQSSGTRELFGLSTENNVSGTSGFEQENNDQMKFKFPSEVYDLLYKLLDPNPDTRLSARNALQHPFIVKYSRK